MSVFVTEGLVDITIFGVENDGIVYLCVNLTYIMDKITNVYVILKHTHLVL